MVDHTAPVEQAEAMRALGALLVRWRTERGLSLSAVAIGAGLQMRTVGATEAGRRRMHAINVGRLIETIEGLACPRRVIAAEERELAVQLAVMARQSR